MIYKFVVSSASNTNSNTIFQMLTLLLGQIHADVIILRRSIFKIVGPHEFHRIKNQVLKI